MRKHEELGSDGHGRRSGIRRLMYRPTNNEGSAGHGSRDWGAIKDRLRLTVRRAPEVVIKVKGSRRSQDSDHDAIAGVLRYMMYISRNGQLLTVDEQGQPIDGRAAVREAHASWDLDMQRMADGRGQSLHPSFNIIFSMPGKTDANKVLDAVQAFARRHFVGHQYVMALHTKETDPADDPPEHPHVHLVLRAEDEDGRRIHIRKGTLRSWREAFAAELRVRGIEANATSRAERGKSLRSRSGAEWHIEMRANNGKGAPSRAMTARFLAAAKELEEGKSAPKPWEIAMAERRRDVVRDLVESAARLRHEGDGELAEQVERFVREMPSLDTERSKMQRALVKQVHDRMQQLEQEASDGRSKS